MGKKTEKISKDKQSIHQSEESLSKTPEPYQCVGNFAQDFCELWKQFYPLELPISITPVNKKGFSLSNAHDNAPTTQPTKKGGKEDKKPQSVAQNAEPEQIQQEDKEIINNLGFKPKQFPVKPNSIALKPTIYADSDNLDKPDNITEISIRRWLVDSNILDVFGLCFAAVNRLSTLNFWRAGLTSEAISKLAEMLSNFESIKCLTIENNAEADKENYYELIKPGSNLLKLHLRYCLMTPKGVTALAEELGSLNNPGNTKLVCLDLNGSHLGDHGAISLAQALKINRTLVSLSLSNCDIGDLGATELIKSLSQYMLTDKEIFARRQIISERNMVETAKSLSSLSRASISSELNSPPLSRRGDSKDRPTSVKSSIKDDKNKRETKGTAKGKKETKEDKSDKSNTKGKKEEKPSAKKSAIVDTAKSASKTKGRSSRPSKTGNQIDALSDSNENLENIHPLLNKVEAVEPGKLLIIGNFMVLMLNLSRNRITESGLLNIEKSVTFQSNLLASSKVNGTGLLKLFLQGNKFDNDGELVNRINITLINRDHKSKTPTIEE